LLLAQFLEGFFDGPHTSGFESSYPRRTPSTASGKFWAFRSVVIGIISMVRG
jgi:hypothetical protein